MRKETEKIRFETGALMEAVIDFGYFPSPMTFSSLIAICSVTAFPQSNNLQTSKYAEFFYFIITFSIITQ